MPECLHILHARHIATLIQLRRWNESEAWPGGQNFTWEGPARPECERSYESHVPAIRAQPVASPHARLACKMTVSELGQGQARLHAAGKRGDGNGSPCCPKKGQPFTSQAALGTSLITYAVFHAVPKPVLGRPLSGTAQSFNGTAST